MVDILITIGIIAFVLLQASVKAKKKAQQQAQRKPHPYRAPQPASPSREDKPFWEELTTDTTLHEEVEETTSYEEIPKNNTYFTYENLEPEINEKKPAVESCSGNDVEINVQNIEDEEGKKMQITLEMEELYKGIVYSEILKRPYN